MPKKTTPQATKGKLSPRPYARLLTMIGDQLIKNDKVALFELIKNAYDADADWVQVRLINFDVEYNEHNQILDISGNNRSIIEIEDNGHGMDWSVISDAWMNPASPMKFIQKRKGERKSKGKKRLLQGEKGIGRYAVYKIGSTVEIYTKSNEAKSEEIYLKCDLSNFDEELFNDRTRKDEKVYYLDEINYEYEIHDIPKEIKPNTIIIQNRRNKRSTHGTLIRISNLKNTSLNYQRVKEIIDDVNKLGSPFAETDLATDFTFDLLINGVSQHISEEFKSRLETVFDRAPIKVTNGKYNGKLRFTFDLGSRKVTIDDENKLSEIKPFKERFCDKKTGKIVRNPECGPFEFQFYVFDLSNDAPPKYFFEKNDSDRDFVKQHRIYLYRDGIRVYPYGDPSDDWLGIDISRGTRRAGDFLSNDQTIGYVAISNEYNGELKDKTNREGLLEIGNAYGDFIALLQTIIGYLHTEFTRYKKSYEQQIIIDNYKKSTVPNQLDIFSEYLTNIVEKDKKREFDAIIGKYKSERKYLIQKAETAEDLAAVGLSVEAASHELMTMILRSKETTDELIKLTQDANCDLETVQEYSERLRGQITFIEEQIKGIQPIFKSSKRKKKNQRIYEIIRRVQKYYDIALRNNNILISVVEEGTPLVVKTNEAVLLQTFINLFDNAVYWLSTIDKKVKKINIKIDGDSYQVMFADDGPGISDDDIPYIFESFFSTKGEQGRGLGLYIAKQLLERNDFTISYEKNKKILSGANFLLDFSSEEE